MADIDKAVELAREHLTSVARERLPDTGDCEMCHLARAVLAMAAVVEAGRRWAETDREYWDGHATSDEVDTDMDALRSAIRTLDAEARRG